MDFMDSGYQHYEDCNPSVVQELKKAVEDTVFDGVDFKFTDVAYLRFLTACNQDKDAAYKAMVEHMEWRKAKAVAQIDVERDCPREVAKGALMLGKDFDKRDRPIIYVLVRKVNKHDRDIIELEKFIIGNMLRAVALSAKDEEKMSIVMDMQSFSLDNMDFELAKLLVDTLQNQFRETLANLFILDAPFIFQACWVIIRPWLDKRTTSKILFVNSQGLKEYVDTDNFSTELQAFKRT